MTEIWRSLIRIRKGDQMAPNATNRSINQAVKKAASALTNLGDAIRQMQRELETSARTAGTGAGAGGRRRRVLTPKARKFLKQQGKYLGLVRHLAKKDVARVKAIRASKGYGPAIKEAMRLSQR